MMGITASCYQTGEMKERPAGTPAATMMMAAGLRDRHADLFESESVPEGSFGQ